jgi:hypothetical protein
VFPNQQGHNQFSCETLPVLSDLEGWERAGQFSPGPDLRSFYAVGQKHRSGISQSAVKFIWCGCRGVAQPGSAPALGAGGLRFKSGRPDQILLDQEVTEAEFWYRCIVVQLGNVKKNSCSKTTRKHRLN